MLLVLYVLVFYAVAIAACPETMHIYIVLSTDGCS